MPELSQSSQKWVINTSLLKWETMWQSAGGWPGAKDSPYAWGLCYNRELSPTYEYCKGDELLYPCAPGASYHGRGAFPLYWWVDWLAYHEIFTANAHTKRRNTNTIPYQATFFIQWPCFSFLNFNLTVQELQLWRDGSGVEAGLIKSSRDFVVQRNGRMAGSDLVLDDSREDKALSSSSYGW